MDKSYSNTSPNRKRRDKKDSILKISISNLSSPSDIRDNLLDWNIIVSKFELQSRYNVYGKIIAWKLSKS